MHNYTVYKLHQNKDKMSHITLSSPITDEVNERLYFNSGYKLDENTRSKKDSNIGSWDDITFELIDGKNIGYTDFLFLQDGVIIFSENILKKRFLQGCFYYSGEIIKIKVLGTPHKYYISNITSTANMLDYEKSIFGPKDQNDQCDILTYSFINLRTKCNRPLFKMEQDWDRSIYTMQRPEGEIEPDFVRSITKYKIDIFEFEELYGFDKYVYS
jgi:hypothetical protein